MEYNLRAAYVKAVKVIDSCKNKYHIEAARRYINSFFKLYSSEIDEKWLGNQVFVADDLLTKKYRKLYEKLDDKQAFLSE